MSVGKRRLLIFMVGGVLLCYSGVFLGRYVWQHIRLNTAQQEPQRLVIEFAAALRDNNTSLAHALASPDLADEIDGWLNQHTNVECRFSLEKMGESYLTVHPVDISRSQQRVYHAYLLEYCANSEQWFCVQVLDIEMEKRNDEWWVTTWGEVRETYTAVCQSVE